jgi:hypothetical protein
MKINRHNYEAFLLDQLEGRLSVGDRLELEQFLLLNPDCKGELTELEPWVLEGEEIPFQNRETLKKNFPHHLTVLGDQNFDMFSIARMEGDLGDYQVKAHQAMLEADDQKAEQWRQWQQTRLVAETLLFKGKDRLKHKRTSGNRVFWISAISSAAAVALLVILFRAEPDLSQQESYVQAPQEETSGQNRDVLQAQEEHVPEVGPVSNPDQPAQSHLSDQLKADPAISTGITKAEPSPESLSFARTEAQKNVEAQALAVSALHFNSPFAAKEADPDQIKPLQKTPVPLHPSSLTLAQLSDVGLQEMVEEYAEEKDLSLWKIVSAGVKGINKLAGSDISLMASRDEDGEVSGFKLKSKRFSLTRPIGREE